MRSHRGGRRSLSLVCCTREDQAIAGRLASLRLVRPMSVNGLLETVAFLSAYTSSPGQKDDAQMQRYNTMSKPTAIPC